MSQASRVVTHAPLPVLLVAIALASQVQAQSQTTVPALERLRVFNETFKDPATVDLDVVRRVLKSAVADSDESLRYAAIDLIGSIRGRELFAPGNPAIAPWQRFAPLTDEFRPAILAALDDSSARVRRAAVYALVAADAEVLPKPIGRQLVRIPPALAARLQDQFAKDDASSVRSWIVNLFGRGGQDHDPRTLAIARSILLKALDDSDEFVVQFAGSAMFEWKISEALPLLIKQLGHPSHIARMGVAAGLQGYGVAARSYLPQIEAAAKREPDEPTRKTLEAAVTRIREGRDVTNRYQARRATFVSF
jgi:HEAT repeat protein